MEIEVELRKGTCKEYLSQKNFTDLVIAITAACTTDNVVVSQKQMREAAGFFKTLSKEVLIARCERIATLSSVLRRVHRHR